MDPISSDSAVIDQATRPTLNIGGVFNGGAVITLNTVMPVECRWDITTLSTNTAPQYNWNDWSPL